MIHLRIVAPEEAAHQALDLLCASDSVFNVVHLHGAAHKPRGDVILCDVAREDASVIISDLKELEIPRTGSIAIEHIDTSISDAAVAAEKSARGLPSDAVVWEEVEARTSEDTELSVSFVLFMVAAMQIAVVGIVIDSPILIVGAMVVGPEFGPLAGDQRGAGGEAAVARPALAARARRGLPGGDAAGVRAPRRSCARSRWTRSVDYENATHPFTDFISNPDCAQLLRGRGGRRRGGAVAHVGQVGRAGGRAGLGDDDPRRLQHRPGRGVRRLGPGRRGRGAAGINLGAIVLAGVVTLFIQRRYYVARRRST